MKRVAETQLTKGHNGDEDVEDVDEPGHGIVKADEQVLSRREIRGLPKRSMAAAPAPPISISSNTPPAPTSGSFSGFGNPSASSSPFSFTASSPSAAPSFMASEPETTKSGPVFTSHSTRSPALASGASNASKTFASLIGGASSSQPLNFSASKPQDKMDEDEDEDAEVKNATAYFMALRGLNNSFLSAVAEAIKTDAFVDLTSYLAHYKSLREAEIKKYEEAKVSAKKNGSSSFTAPAAPAAAAKPAPSMPAPPTTFSGFAGFGAPSASSSSINSSSGGGFSFKPGAASSGGSSPFSFPSSSTPAERTEAPKSTFSFGAPSSSSSTSASNPFGVSSSSTPSVFGSNLFGGASFTSAKPEADKSTTNGSASNTFGPSSSAFSTPAPSLSNGTGSLFGASSATATSSSGSSNLAPSFGTSDSTNSANPLFAGFGKPPAAKIGNPVGFGFGNPSSSPSVNPFTFGSSSSSSQPANPLESKVKEESGSGSQESTSAPVADGGHPPLLRTSSQHDVEGEGEEQEDTEHAVRSKVFRLTKQSDGTQNWSDLGVGMLRVKTHKTSGARRLLLRNSSTGKILINFNIYTGMTPSVAKNTVSFVGHDNSDPAAPGTAVPFKLRVKTDDEAHQLKGALDRAIDFVKSKSD